ncbi:MULTISPECIES: ABC transporter ATP-binding protein [unclassified Leptospira]|uniref:ABC transporter ATP-binding protein n=1 Tax=unclassified Leptospira TaxID=2633828 RepID=UPI0002BDD550|nr:MULTISPECIES: ABC transporter ATP-binding protein [unclassified Leptospira]EMK00523.1 ABC transporter, ATP-binding protein [Leptospira sp. B5-022]MCR1793142.1 ABC transporter ATP-binding protein [Leptospira sp. id769339]
MPQFAIEIEHLRKFYPKVKALQGIDLKIPQGGIFGLLGQNGAGKTTLVRILLGFSKQTEGHCKVLGLEPSPLARTKIGYLPERMAIPTYLSGKEFLEASFRLALVPSSIAKKKSNEFLEKLGLAEAADRKISTYSKGMLQRLGLANALGAEPELLLLDEPGTGLDPAGYKEFRELILEENKKRGVTILINSHRLLEVEQICTEIGILHKGNLMAQGKLDELKQGKDRIRIRLESAPESYLEEISLEHKIDGKTWEIRPKPEVDLKKLPAILVEKGAEIFLYERKTESLEDVFFRLTQGSGDNGGSN